MNIDFTNEGLNVRVESLSKNEYIALELTRIWNGTQHMRMNDILDRYDQALEHLEGKKNGA